MAHRKHHWRVELLGYVRGRRETRSYHLDFDNPGDARVEAFGRWTFELGRGESHTVIVSAAEPCTCDLVF